MTFRTKALLVGALLAVFLSAAVTPTAARNLSLRTDWTTRQWRGTWAGLRITDSEAVFTSCPLTLEGSFQTGTFAKTRSVLVGYVTDSRTALVGCTLLRETLPWAIQYEAFSGTLPTITRVTLRIIGFELRFDIGGARCLIRSTEAEPLAESLTRAAGGGITSADLSGTFTSDIECFFIRFTAEGRSTTFGTPPPPPQPSTVITLSLI